MLNSYRFSDDNKVCRVFFKDGSYFLIDATDFELVSKYSWFKGKRGYPTMHTSRKSPEGYKTRPLHRYLIKIPDKADIDHINGDKLDNRRSNLRACTHQQNMFNQKKRSTNSSGYIGVSLFKATGMFEAYIHHSGKKIYLGLYHTAEEAAYIRDKEAKKLFGKYARLNFPDTF